MYIGLESDNRKSAIARHPGGHDTVTQKRRNLDYWNAIQPDVARWGCILRICNWDWMPFVARELLPTRSLNNLPNVVSAYFRNLHPGFLRLAKCFETVNDDYLVGAWSWIFPFVSSIRVNKLSSILIFKSLNLWASECEFCRIFESSSSWIFKSLNLWLFESLNPRISKLRIISWICRICEFLDLRVSQPWNLWFFQSLWFFETFNLPIWSFFF